ncbi:DUF2332 family protein [Paracoccus sp. TK19116]|uniref:DUF2332 family protein n=1 Tax=Paracoccus albicereus TaxID=2922394 RepID=A0ABT1MR37_9RHOB|nr:DUF2332 family protein [Paracoccus albicereus]MCQ0970757.1 DUF2332 family protein [Paracoccus albicereus]
MKPREAFADQARSCCELGSPLTARICERLGAALSPEQGEVARRILNWPGDASSRGDSVPLRLAGALHGLVLDGSATALADAYTKGDPDTKLLVQTICDHEAQILDWLDHPPQTNEVARSAAIIAAARFAVSHRSLPIEALELGASAGLNLNFARCTLLQDGAVSLRPDWRGDLPHGMFTVTDARGVDLNPLDPQRDALRLLAYCWADQADRLARLRAALQIARVHSPEVDRGDAADWLEAQLASPAPGRLRFVYHTVAWQYFPPKVQARCEAALNDAGRRAGPTAPLAHFAMEADGGRGASLHLRLWDGQLRIWSLGRADFHGRWIEWHPVAESPSA